MNKMKARRKKYSLKWLWKASIIPEVIPLVICFGFFSLAVVVLHLNGFSFSFPALNLVVPAVVLGLLLVFRTNTGYERFWEARKLWGRQIALTRNIAQFILTSIATQDQLHAQEKQKTILLLPAFGIATKLYLRSEPINHELRDLMSEEQYELLCHQAHPPLMILSWMRSWVQKQFQRNLIGDRQMVYLSEIIDDMGFCLGGCERILNTPMPLAYSLHLRHLIYIYCLVFPFQIVDSLLWLTIPGTCLVTFALFGIEKIGVEIEDPFGYDENDLPLDRYCKVIQDNVEDIVSMVNAVNFPLENLESVQESKSVDVMKWKNLQKPS